MSFKSVDEIIKHYTKEDKSMEEYDLIQDEREHQYRLQLQRRMARCGDSSYPEHLARQDIIEAEQERLRMMGLEQEETE